jgi:hypothetical protein
LCASLIVTQAGASLLTFDLNEASIELGDTIDVDIVVSELSGENISAFEFDVIFDESVLAFELYSLSDSLGSLASLDAYDLSSGYLGSGSINLKVASTLFDFSFQSDNMTLATLTFTGLASGISSLDFDQVAVMNDIGDSLTAIPVGSSLEVVNPVPLPSTVLLMATSLILGFIAVTKKNSRLSH